MKNTIRVRKDAATKAASVQTKTSRRANSGAENVRILFREPNGKVFADFEIPKTFHAAMLRDAKAKGIGLQQWIENAVWKKITKAQNHSASPAPAETIIPAQIALEAETAIANLERTGNAAVAFAMMQGYSIQKSSQNNRDWEALAVPGFSQGALELARIASSDFTKVFAGLASAVKIMVTVCREIHQPVKIAQESLAEFVLQIDPSKALYRIESVTHALIHCIELQSWAVCCESTGHQQAGCFEITQHLEAVEKSIGKVTFNLATAYIAAMASRKSQEVAA